MTIRKAKVASKFYASTSTGLKKQIKNCFLSKLGPQELPSKTLAKKTGLYALISPHAGFSYSGHIAAFSYLEASKYKDIPKTIILIGPNHFGLGKNISVYPKGYWQTPLGKIEIDENVVNRLAKEGFIPCAQGHREEHSIEVQLPFLQYIFNNNFKIVCISMLDQSLKTVNKLAKSLVKIIKKERALIVSTTDMSHYETNETAYYKDSKILDILQKGNINFLYKEGEKLSISACGLGPTAVAVKTCFLLGAKQINLLKYETSAAITKDYQSVVGYAALEITKNGRQKDLISGI